MLINLIAARKAQGMSQATVAAHIGKSQSVYSKIERGEVKLSARDADTLCALFNINLAYLLA